MGAAISGSKMGRKLVFPPLVLLKNAAPPEMSGTFCAVLACVAASKAATMATSRMAQEISA